MKQIYILIDDFAGPLDEVETFLGPANVDTSTFKKDYKVFFDTYIRTIKKIKDSKKRDEVWLKTSQLYSFERWLLKNYNFTKIKNTLFTL